MKNYFKKIYKRGFSLVEIIIYTAFLVIILSLIAAFFYQAINFKVLNKIASAEFQNSQLAAAKITQDLRKAQAITVPVDQNFTQNLILQGPEGQVSWEADKGVLKRNGVALTDSQVTLDLSGSSRGFRKIGNTIQFKFGIFANIKPFGRPIQIKEYQTTVKLAN